MKYPIALPVLFSSFVTSTSAQTNPVPKVYEPTLAEEQIVETKVTTKLKKVPATPSPVITGKIIKIDQNFLDNLVKKLDVNKDGTLSTKELKENLSKVLTENKLALVKEAKDHIWLKPGDFSVKESRKWSIGNQTRIRIKLDLKIVTKGGWWNSFF